MWTALPLEGREERGEVGTDQAVIDGSHFFIRGRIEIPVVNTGDLFAWLVWAEVSGEDFLNISDLWTVKGREATAPYEARLANNLGLYSEHSLGLRVRLHTRPIGDRPFVEIVEEHPLRYQQRNGISAHRVQEIAHLLWPGQ
jgi:hypothetical protein